MKMEDNDVKLNRLGSDTGDMVKLIKGFTVKGVAIRFRKVRISTDSEMGKMVVTILSLVTQTEGRRILERTNEGRQEVRLNSIRLGRKRTVDWSKITAFINNGHSATKKSGELNIVHSTIYQVLKESTAI